MIPQGSRVITDRGETDAAGRQAGLLASMAIPESSMWGAVTHDDGNGSKTSRSS
jgi:hypothetical protein